MATPVLTIKFGANISFGRDDTAGIPSKSFSGSIVPAGYQFVGQPQSISHTAWTALNFGQISGAPAKFLLFNLDAAYAVQIAEDNAGAHIHDTITALDFVLRSPNSGTLYAKFATADGQIQIYAGG